MTEHPHDSDPAGSIAEAQHRAVHAAILSTLRAVAPRHAVDAAHDLLTRTSWTMWAEAGKIVVEWDHQRSGHALAWWDDSAEPYLGIVFDRSHVLDVLEVVQNIASHLTGWLAENSPADPAFHGERLSGVSASPTLTPDTDSIDLDVIDLRDR